MTDTKLVLHIGYHKTGTTFFQNQVFNKHPEIDYLGRTWVDEQLAQFFFDVGALSEVEFNSENLKGRFNQILDRLERNGRINNKKVLLISHESLHSGDSYFGFTIERQARRIKSVFPDAMILISVRQQSKMIESHYTNYIHHGGHLSFAKFFNYSKEFNIGLKQKLNYYNLLNLYQDLFGKSNVHVMVFEHVFNDPIDLISMFRFLEIDTISIKNTEQVNKRLSKTSITLLRFINKILFRNFDTNYKNRLEEKHSIIERVRWQCIRILKFVEKKFSRKTSNSSTYLNTASVSSIKDHYRSSNMLLSEAISVNLKEHNYY